MSTTKDEDDTLLNVPSTDPVIEEEEDTNVMDEHKYIIKDDNIKVKASSIKDSKTVLAWDVDWTLNGVGMVLIFAGRSIYSFWFGIFFLNSFLFVE